jgi:hypothetical protein
VPRPDDQAILEQDVRVQVVIERWVGDASNHEIDAAVAQLPKTHRDGFDRHDLKRDLG